MTRSVRGYSSGFWGAWSPQRWPLPSAGRVGHLAQAGVLVPHSPTPPCRPSIGLGHGLGGPGQDSPRGAPGPRLALRGCCRPSTLPSPTLGVYSAGPGRAGLQGTGREATACWGSTQGRAGVLADGSQLGLFSVPPPPLPPPPPPPQNHPGLAHPPTSPRVTFRGPARPQAPICLPGGPVRVRAHTARGTEPWLRSPGSAPPSSAPGCWSASRGPSPGRGEARGDPASGAAWGQDEPARAGGGAPHPLACGLRRAVPGLPRAVVRARPGPILCPSPPVVGGASASGRRGPDPSQAALLQAP